MGLLTYFAGFAPCDFFLIEMLFGVGGGLAIATLGIWLFANTLSSSRASDASKQIVFRPNPRSLLVFLSMAGLGLWWAIDNFSTKIAKYPHNFAIWYGMPLIGIFVLLTCRRVTVPPGQHSNTATYVRAAVAVVVILAGLSIMLATFISSDCLQTKFR